MITESPKEIPFLQEFRTRILIGAKTWTCRTSRKADIGERVIAYPGDGQIVLRIVRVYEAVLGWVAENHFREEGCVSPEEFKEIWRRLHPRKGFDPRQTVWVHEFERDTT